MPDDLAGERRRIEPALSREHERRLGHRCAAAPPAPRRAPHRARGGRRPRPGHRRDRRPPRRRGGRARRPRRARGSARRARRAAPRARRSRVAEAPFCGPKIRAAATKVVETSHATSTSAPPRSKPSASSAPSPPSVVAEPPTATITRLAPGVERRANELAGAGRRRLAADRSARRRARGRSPEPSRRRRSCRAAPTPPRRAPPAGP